MGGLNEIFIKEGRPALLAGEKRRLREESIAWSTGRGYFPERRRYYEREKGDKTQQRGGKFSYRELSDYYVLDLSRKKGVDGALPRSILSSYQFQKRRNRLGKKRKASSAWRRGAELQLAKFILMPLSPKRPLH